MPHTKREFWDAVHDMPSVYIEEALSDHLMATDGENFAWAVLTADVEGMSDGTDKMVKHLEDWFEEIDDPVEHSWAFDYESPDDKYMGMDRV